MIKKGVALPYTVQATTGHQITQIEEVTRTTGK